MSDNWNAEAFEYGLKAIIIGAVAIGIVAGLLLGAAAFLIWYLV